mmetsp:Transcript_127956/g.292331  ORF Transcript_127956/g.292331 Transcript_127956/m.292331 type:complete len:202 (-) Transcript_127956:1168-1773(-)
MVGIVSHCNRYLQFLRLPRPLPQLTALDQRPRHPHRRRFAVHFHCPHGSHHRLHDLRPHPHPHLRRAQPHGVDPQASAHLAHVHRRLRHALHHPRDPDQHHRRSGCGLLRHRYGGGDETGVCGVRVCGRCLCGCRGSAGFLGHRGGYGAGGAGVGPGAAMEPAGGRQREGGGAGKQLGDPRGKVTNWFGQRALRGIANLFG